jgi:small-conductance mechanosensitive channel
MSSLSILLAHPWTRLAAILLLALIVGAIAVRVLRYAVRHLLVGENTVAIVLRRCGPPFELALPVIGVTIASYSGVAAQLPLAALQHAATIAVIAVLTWLGVRILSGIERAVAARHPVDVKDNLRSRSLITQSRVLSHTGMFLLGLIGLAAALMTFPGVRQFGASLLASAGVAGLVIGLAARPVLSNLLAGLQIALTEPIRLDDVVIIDNEWGRIEEIKSTYVVVRIWDERRLVVPLQWFIENSFQNWTRTSAELLGTVLLWVDYSTPLAPLRAELERICHEAPEWDGRVCKIQTTDSDAHAMQIRALVSAADSGSAWDLRCRVREGLIEFLQRDHPQSLPRLRVETGPTGASGT